MKGDIIVIKIRIIFYNSKIRDLIVSVPKTEF
nr:MAG TPA: hypothetical protein [Herelleviridae sp.]